MIPVVLRLNIQLDIVPSRPLKPDRARELSDNFSRERCLHLLILFSLTSRRCFVVRYDGSKATFVRVPSQRYLLRRHDILWLGWIQDEATAQSWLDIGSSNAIFCARWKLGRNIEELDLRDLPRDITKYT